MMRIFGIFDRKKQTPGRPCSTNSRSSVHPAKSDGKDAYSVKRAKIKELLGVVTPRECREVDELLNQAFCRDPLSDEDTDLLGSGITEEIDLENESVCDPGAKMQAIHTDVCVELTVQKHAPLTSYKSSPIKDGGERDTQKSFPIAKSTKGGSVQGPTKTFRQARPAKLACVSKIRRESLSERVTAPQPCRIGGRKYGHCMESFPLPPPFEKHYLPTPRTPTAEEVSFVAHPLPQPPLTARALEDKSMVWIALCEPPVKPQLTAKEYDTIARAVPCDPSRKTTQRLNLSERLSGGSFLVLQQVPPTSPPIAQQPQSYQTPHNTPPTTPRQQAHWTPQSTSPTTPRQQAHGTLQSTPTTPPISHAYGTPQNSSPTTPRSQALHMPQEAPSTTPRLWTPHSTSPSTPRPQIHPQVLSNKNQKMQPPVSPNRQSPRLTVQLQNQSPVLLPSEQSYFAYSPPCSPLPRSLCPRKWVKGAVLGQGTFGTVHEGLNLEDGSFFAVKMSSKEDISPEIQQEVDVLSKLDHPNIVRYLGSSIVERRLCIFLELVRMGSLDSILRKYKPFEDQTIRNYTKQILLGLEYLHQKRTIHRDIKSANILVDVNGQVKLADFGIAKQVGESLVSSVKGTPLYMAPEVLTLNADCYSFPADIWSLGCTVLEMADGKPPWSNLAGFGFLFKVKSGELPPLPEHLSLEGRDFIQRCLSMIPKDRPTASELLQHPFVSSAVTPEPLFIRSPPLSPLSPMIWPPASHMISSNDTWACGNCHLSSLNNEVVTGYPRAHTVVHGR